MITEDLYLHKESDMMLRYLFDRVELKRTLQLGYYDAKYNEVWIGVESPFIARTHLFYISSIENPSIFPDDFIKIGDI